MKNVSASQTFINEHAPELFSKIHNKIYFQQSKSGECRFLDGEREGWGVWVGLGSWGWTGGQGDKGTRRGETRRGETRRRLQIEGRQGDKARGDKENDDKDVAIS
jgi:hypothetical protein